MPNLKELTIKERTLELLDIARIKYGNIPEVEIIFTDKGSALGRAIVKNGKYKVEYSREAIEQDVADAYNDTIPHELAHIIECWKYHNGRKMTHSRIWKSICINLGGTGQRCSNSEVKLTPKRIHRYYKYVANSGKVIWFSRTRHNKLQSGKIIFRLKKGDEVVGKLHFTGIESTKLDLQRC